MVRLKGTPAERRQMKAQVRASNRAAFIRDRAAQAASTHQLVVVACNAAQAASRRLSDEGRRALAYAVAQAVEAADIPANRRNPL